MVKLRAVLTRRWPILVVLVLVGSVAGFFSTSGGDQRKITRYRAQQLIVVNRIAGNPADVAQDALKVNRGEVPKRAAETLGSPEDYATYSAMVDVEADTDSNSIRLSVDDPDSALGSEVVQAFTNAFLEVVNKELRRDLDALLTRLELRLQDANADLEKFDAENGFVTRRDLQLPPTVDIDTLIAERERLVAALTAAKQEYDNATVRSPEREPYSTLGPEKPFPASDFELIEVPDSPLFRAGLLGLVGLLLGAGLVMLIERIHPRIDTRDELADAVGVPIIAEIGKERRRRKDKSDIVDLSDVWAEPYRRVRSAIQFVQADARTRLDREEASGLTQTPTTQTAVITGHRALSGSIPRTFLFVSALPGEGKSTSVSLTAMALAEVGEQVLVVNADFRRPRVEKYLGVETEQSIADRAEMRVDRPSIETIVSPTAYENLWIAAAGRPTLEVGSRIEVAKEVAAEAARRGGTVLIDSSPLRVSNDPIDLLSAADEVVLVVRAGRTTLKSIEDTLQLLEMHHAPMMGVILIGTLATREMYSYYASYYSKTAASEDEVLSSEPAESSDRPVGAHAPPGSE